MWSCACDCRRWKHHPHRRRWRRQQQNNHQYAGRRRWQHNHIVLPGRTSTTLYAGCDGTTTTRQGADGSTITTTQGATTMQAADVGQRHHDHVGRPQPHHDYCNGYLDLRLWRSVDSIFSGASLKIENLGWWGLSYRPCPWP